MEGLYVGMAVVIIVVIWGEQDVTIGDMVEDSERGLKQSCDAKQEQALLS